MRSAVSGVAGEFTATMPKGEVGRPLCFTALPLEAELEEAEEAEE